MIKFDVSQNLKKRRMKRLSIWLFILFLTVNSFGQNYIDYQRTFNLIDEDILIQNNKSAIERLDSIYSNYEFIFAKHCIKALQICISVNDSISADKWLAKCFMQGVPLWVIRNDDITKKSLQYSTTYTTIQKFDSLYSIYKASIDINLSRKIDSLFTIDQKYTHKINDGFFALRYTIYYLQWLKNNKRQFAIIDNIIDIYGFPGERLLGLGDMTEDSSSIKFFKRNGLSFLGDKRVYFMLIHYYTTPRKDINDKLLHNVINGFIPAYQFGALNDFMARWGKKRYGDYQYFNVWHQDNKPENLDKINKRRLSIGLNTFEQQKRNIAIDNKLWKDKKVNLEIILE